MSVKNRKHTYSVTGPDIDRNGYETGGIALSAAITFASRASGEATYYARNADGDVFGHAERDEDGTVYITRVKGDR